jgi:hypothetical protein
VFFSDLEMWNGLNIDSATHLWLLHHLFLPEINTDAQDWTGTWNYHVIELQGQRSRSPRDMFFFGMLEEGIRGRQIDLPVDEIAGYGIDWEALDDPQIRAHHDANSGVEVGVDDQAHIPLVENAPERFSIVEVDEPNCPLSPEQIFFLDSQLSTHSFMNTRSIEAYRLRWVTALALFSEMYVL